VSLNGQRGRAESRKRNGRPEGRPSCNPLPEAMCALGRIARRLPASHICPLEATTRGRFGGPSFCAIGIERGGSSQRQAVLGEARRGVAHLGEGQECDRSSRCAVASGDTAADFLARRGAAASGQGRTDFHVFERLRPSVPKVRRFGGGWLQQLHLGRGRCVGSGRPHLPTDQLLECHSSPIGEEPTSRPS